MADDNSLGRCLCKHQVQMHISLHFHICLFEGHTRELKIGSASEQKNDLPCLALYASTVCLFVHF